MRYSKLTVVVVLVLATFLASATAQPKYVLRLSSPVSKDHAFGRGAEKFKQLVADSTIRGTDLVLIVGGDWKGPRDGVVERQRSTCVGGRPQAPCHLEPVWVSAFDGRTEGFELRFVSPEATEYNPCPAEVDFGEQSASRGKRRCRKRRLGDSR